MLARSLVVFVLAMPTSNLHAQTSSAKKVPHDEKVEELKSKLGFVKSEIGSLNEKKACDGDGDCEVLEMGWRACGGPSAYLVASARSAKFKTIQAKIKEFTALEREIANSESGMDCTPTPKLPEAKCVKQECK